MIKFICWEPNEAVTAYDRREAIKMIQKNTFKKYKNVVVCLPNGEKVNLESPRAKEYFGIKRRIIMIWHDCKTDPPKKSGKYILCYLYNGLFYEDQWDIAYFDSIGNKWHDPIDDIDYGSKDSNWAKISTPYKWAEVDLSEVE